MYSHFSFRAAQGSTVRQRLSRCAWRMPSVGEGRRRLGFSVRRLGHGTPGDSFPIPTKITEWLSTAHPLWGPHTLTPRRLTPGLSNQGIVPSSTLEVDLDLPIGS